MEPQEITDDGLLGKMEAISEISEGCRLDFESFAPVSGDVDKLAGFLGITARQAIILSAIAELSFQKSATVDALARHLDCSVLKVMRLMNDIESLEGKNYLRRLSRRRGGQQTYSDIGFAVASNVIDALRKEDASFLDSESSYDLPKFLRVIADLADKRSEDELSTADVLREAERQISATRELPFVSFIDESLSLTESKCVAFAISYYRLRERFHIGVESIADELFDDFSDHLRFVQEVSSGTHELISRGILKISASGFDIEKSFALTDKTVKKLYLAYPALETSEPQAPGMISNKTILPRQLFFNKKVSGRLNELETILKPSSFRKYCRELSICNFRPGVTAMFYGEPGTGKTEAVYQIARKTGRDIMMVDLSQTKSKWFGESEKVVRQIFIDYDSIRKNVDCAPILFINEADGLFGRRMAMGGDASSTDQTMNTIQNILLQSLETFEGILITTTNLTGNLDRAFERRFSFRIEFERPDQESRRKIWLSKVPDLTSIEAGRLANRFELTGGDIDVHVKKILIRKVLKRAESLSALLEASCNESQGFGQRPKVGYR